MDALTVLEMHALVQEYASYLRDERMRSPRTVSRYLQTMNKFVGFLESRHVAQRIELEQLGKDELVAFLKRESRNGSGEPSRTAWNLALSVLRSFYGFLFQADRISVNPALRVTRQKTVKKERNCLSLDEMLRLVEAVKQYSPPTQRSRNLVLFKVFLHTGLRVAEVASLTLDQVDMETCIFWRVLRKGDKLLSVEFNDVVHEALDDFLPKRQRMQVPERALFLSKRGDALSVRMMQELVRTYAKRAGITRNVTPHVLRHASATLLAEEGASLDVIKAVLGHESVTTTQLYVHTSSALRRKAVDAVGKSWRRAERRFRQGGKLSENSASDLR